MALGPDVRVRLSAEGERQVVDALRKVRRESVRSAKQSERAFKGMGNALQGVRGLLLTLGAAAAVGAFTRIAKNAAEAADETGKLAQRLGTTVERMSALEFSAQQAAVPVRALNSTIPILSQRVAEFAQGSAKATRVFDALGISVEDLAGKDTAEQFSLVAQAFGELEDSSEKTALAVDLFSTTGAKLIPLLNDLSKRGIDEVAESMKGLGLIFSEDAARAAQSLRDNMNLLGRQATVLASRFVEGLAPAITGALVQVGRRDVGSLGDSLVSLGRTVGTTVVAAFISLQDTFDTLTTRAFQFLNTLNLGLQAMVLLRKEDREQAAELLGFINTLEEHERARRSARRQQRVEDIAAFQLPALRGGAQAAQAPIAGLPDPQAEAAKQRQKEFQEALKESQRLLREIRVQSEAIRIDVEQGLITEAEGRRRILELERARKPELVETLALVRAAAEATGSPAALLQVQELENAIRRVGVAGEETATILQQVGESAREGALSQLTDLFANAAAAAGTFGQRVVAAAGQVVAAINRIIAREIALKLIKGFLGGFSGGGEVPTPIGPRQADGSFASGGVVRGPGTGTSDSIPARLSAGEFVVPAAAVRSPGVLNALEDLRSGFVTPALGRIQGARRFADGGLVSGAGVTRQEVGVTIGLEAGLISKAIEGPAGARSVVRVLAANPKAAGSALGGRGG